MLMQNHKVLHVFLYSNTILAKRIIYFFSLTVRPSNPGPVVATQHEAPNDKGCTKL